MSMVEINLCRARPGCEVTFRCGGKATIQSIRENDGLIGMRFNGDETSTYHFGPDGRRFVKNPAILDIVAISNPPLTAEERLAEIVKIAYRERNSSLGAGVQCLVSEILAFAEGHKP